MKAIVVGAVAGVALLLFLLRQLGFGGPVKFRRVADPAPIPPNVADEARRLVQDGNLIAAVKLLRAKTGCSLTQVKDALDGLK